MQENEKQYQITKITYRDGTDRKETDYIKRIGLIGTIAYLAIGYHFIFIYSKPTNENKGALKTSYVESINKNDNEIIVTTENSVFYIKEV